MKKIRWVAKSNIYTIRILFSKNFIETELFKWESIKILYFWLTGGGHFLKIFFTYDYFLCHQSVSIPVLSFQLKGEGGVADVQLLWCVWGLHK